MEKASGIVAFELNCFLVMFQRFFIVRQVLITETKDEIGFEIIASLAEHYNGVNKPDRAEKVTKNYISQCDSTNLYVNKEYAYSLFMQFKYDEAIPKYEKLIAQGFDNFESNFILGLCYEDQPDNEKALKHYQKAVLFKSDNATCLFHLALMEKSFCMDSLSMAHFNQSLEVSLLKVSGCICVSVMLEMQVGQPFIGTQCPAFG